MINKETCLFTSMCACHTQPSYDSFFAALAPYQGASYSDFTTLRIKQSSNGALSLEKKSETAQQKINEFISKYIFLNHQSTGIARQLKTVALQETNVEHIKLVLLALNVLQAQSLKSKTQTFITQCSQTIKEHLTYLNLPGLAHPNDLLSIQHEMPISTTPQANNDVDDEARAYIFNECSLEPKENYLQLDLEAQNNHGLNPFDEDGSHVSPTLSVDHDSRSDSSVIECPNQANTTSNWKPIVDERPASPIPKTEQGNSISSSTASVLDFFEPTENNKASRADSARL